MIIVTNEIAIKQMVVKVNTKMNHFFEFVCMIGVNTSPFGLD